MPWVRHPPGRRAPFGATRTVAVPTPPVSGNYVTIRRLSWAPDGRHLAVSLVGEEYRATGVSINDTDQQSLLHEPSGPTFQGATFCSSPALPAGPV